MLDETAKESMNPEDRLQQALELLGYTEQLRASDRINLLITLQQFAGATGDDDLLQACVTRRNLIVKDALTTNGRGADRII